MLIWEGWKWLRYIPPNQQWNVKTDIWKRRFRHMFNFHLILFGACTWTYILYIYIYTQHSWAESFLLSLPRFSFRAVRSSVGEETALMAASLVEVHKHHVFWGQRDTMEVGKWTISRPTSYWNRAISIAILDYCWVLHCLRMWGLFQAQELRQQVAAGHFGRGFQQVASVDFQKVGCLGPARCCF